jgi:hypothetical protein
MCGFMICVRGGDGVTRGKSGLESGVGIIKT